MKKVTTYQLRRKFAVVVVVQKRKRKTLKRKERKIRIIIKMIEAKR